MYGAWGLVLRKHIVSEPEQIWKFTDLKNRASEVNVIDAIVSAKKGREAVGRARIAGRKTAGVLWSQCCIVQMAPRLEVENYIPSVGYRGSGIVRM